VREPAPWGVSHLTSHSYRPDIDCLRAFAVISVIAYHYDIPPFRSGFVGVDVFFVISGFLITRNIWTDVRDGTFSFAAFYRRRARRILPASFAMLTVVLIVGSLVLLPQASIGLAQQTLAVLTFSSNFLFWSQQGYFDSAAITKPLLHTWSLAVEEQYYFLFPIAALAAFSLRRPLMLGCFAAITGLSLLLCVGQTRLDQGAAFYLLPARIWELGFGALLALEALPSLRCQRTRIVICALGWALLAVSINAFTSRMPYPGIAALLPCTGAILVIWSDPPLNKTALRAARPLIVTGLWSYSLYLWHWPVASLAHAVWGAPTWWLAKLTLICCCAVLSITSYYLVEQPMRRASWTVDRRILSVAGVSLVAACVLVLRSSGFPSRFSPEERRVAGYLTADYSSAYETGRCFLWPQQQFKDLDPSCIKPGAEANVFLWGDSHAAHLIAGLKRAFPSINLLRATMAGCLPFDAYGQTDACRAFNEDVLQAVERTKPKLVIISANWTQTIFAPAAKASLMDAIKRVASAGSRIVVIGPSPQYANAVPSIYISVEHFGLTSANRLEPFVEVTDEFMKPLLDRDSHVEYISLLDLICRGSDCPLMALNAPIAWDQGHFTEEGSIWVGSLIAGSSDTLRQSLQIAP
jgi:peptidoglycan/LPS O-acetylase OafA/YrhL